jgi:hypothetical protein
MSSSTNLPEKVAKAFARRESAPQHRGDVFGPIDGYSAAWRHSGALAQEAAPGQSVARSPEAGTRGDAIRRHPRLGGRLASLAFG